jgi:DNA polymerase III delta prime subunit
LDDWTGDLTTITNAETAVRNDTDQYIQEHMKTSLWVVANHAEKMEKRLGDIHQTVKDLIALQQKLSDDKDASECLHDLFNGIGNPQLDMERIETKKGKLLHEASDWVLTTDSFAAITTWGDSDSRSCRLMWIKGPAGTGKTMLMICIIRELSGQVAALAPSLSYFFCQGTGSQKLNSVTAALRSLIWMLLVQQPHLIAYLQDAYKHSGVGLFKGENEFYALRCVFENMLGGKNLSSVYFIIDALDELDRTDPGLEELLQVISTSLDISTKVKWLVSSRPEVDVLAKVKVEDLRPNTNALDTSKALVELDVEHLANPIGAYIDHKLSVLRGKRGYTDSVLAEVSNEVLQRAKDNFLWVFLVFNDLKIKNGKHAIESIKKYPSGLSELYNHKMSGLESDGGEYLQPCKDVLAATCLAYRPLTFSELEALFPWSTQADPAVIVEKCGSFLTITGETVSLTHQSARDYLAEKWLQQAGVARSHVDISMRCIETISSKLKRNICELDFGIQSKDIAPPELEPLAPIQYSCAFWADHLCVPDSECSDRQIELMDDGRVHTFLKEHFLHWLESLSLLGKLSDGMQSIRRLLGAVQVCVSIV